MRSLFVLSLFVLVLPTAACQKDSNAPASVSQPTSNSYFNEFMVANADSSETLPPVGTGRLEVGGDALIDGSVVTISKIFSDGRAEVIRNPEGNSYMDIVSAPVARKNGTGGLYEDYFALADDSVVKVLKVFADGRAQVLRNPENSNAYKDVVSNLTPQKFGKYEGVPALSDNSVVTILKVFIDGRCQILRNPENYSKYKDTGMNLVPRKNGAAGLIEGNFALAGNSVVKLLIVFADGRAQVLRNPDSPSTSYKDVVGGLVPQS